MSRRNDSDRESKIITELRKKNRKLSIQNQQLRKQLRLHQDRSDVDPFEDEEEATPSKIVRIPEDDEGFQCPKCGAYTKNIFDLVGRLYYRCSCGSKGRVNK